MDDDNDDRDDTKRRSRNLSEKKRRDQFNSLVNDLSALISTSSRKMDKSTVLKSTIAFLKHHNEATDRSKVFEIQQDWKPSFLSNDEFTQLMLESLDGFIIVFGSSGSIYYASDSITAQLGYLPCELMKMTIFDLVYEMDHENIFNIFLNPKPVIEPMQTDINNRNQISFFAYLKRGGLEDRDSNTYEMVKFVGYFRNDANLDGGHQQHSSASKVPRIFQMNPTVELDKKLVFVGTGRLQMPQLIREITAIDPTRNEFTSKHSMEWKFLFLDHRAPPIIGYMPFEVLGTSGYDYYHFDDLDSIISCHEELMKTGKGKSTFYRFLTKGQQWIWLQTDFCITYNQFNTKPDYVVCSHKVINYADVIKTYKAEKDSLNSDRQLPNEGDDIKGSPAPKTITAVNADSNTLTPGDNSNICGPINILNDVMHAETSPCMDTTAMWTASSTPTGNNYCQINSLKPSSRAASSYGNISSTGISPNVKRKRYFYNGRGNESDSTSMSADSATSRNSLMTHLSANRQRMSSKMLQTNNQQTNNMQYSGSTGQQRQSIDHNATSNSNLQQQHQNLIQTNNNHHGQVHQQHSQKVLPILQQQTLPPNATDMLGTPCRYPPTNTAFSAIRNPQIVGPTFLEPQQYLTAIPVQPVIASFPVAPVLSPLPVRLLTPQTDYETGPGTYNSSLLKNQQDMMAGPVVMTANQTQLQEQLQRKHDELQKLIMQQQDELRIVSEQLLLARYTLLQPMMTMNYNSQPPEPTAVGPNSSSRSYNFQNNTVQPQFNQYGFAMNSAEIRQQQEQQLIMEQHHNLNEQMHQHHQSHQVQNHQEVNSMQHHPSLQHQSHNQFENNLQQQQHDHHHHHHQQQQPQQQQQNQNRQQQQSSHQQQEQQLFSARNIVDLEQFAQEELYAFLNLSPIQNISGLPQVDSSVVNVNTDKTTGIESLSQHACITDVINPAVPQSGTQNSMQFTPAAPINSNLPTPIPSGANNTSEDSLLSYMQMATATNQTLNFPLSMSDDGSDTQSEGNKLLSGGALHMGVAQSDSTIVQQQQRSPFFSADTFPDANSATRPDNSRLTTSTTTVETSASNMTKNYENTQERLQHFHSTSTAQTDAIIDGCGDNAAAEGDGGT